MNQRFTIRATRWNAVFTFLLFGFGFSSLAYSQAWGLPEMSSITKDCLKCHKDTDHGIYQQWGNSKHFRANVGCYECHAAEEGEVDAFNHEGQWIATIVSPKDCSRCHTKEGGEFADSHHSKAGRIMGSLDNTLAEVVEGNRGMVTPSFQNGISAAAVNGCWTCHGTEVKVLPGGKLDPATWPNTGIGRINPDGSEGSCSACHSRHSFSAEQARNPDNCGKCHMGPDHPQIEIFYESKHGIAYRAFKDKMNMDSSKWVVGEDYHQAPTCATCHMSATPDRPATKNKAAVEGMAVTHDVGMRISWNNRPAISVRPEVSDKKMGLPGANINWETRRGNMQNVCLNCHEQQWVDNFYVQYDSLIDLYHDKFAEPGVELYNLAKPLMRPAGFSNDLDWTWFEIWHHEGRRARHGAAMMGPDYTHWHGTYEVAKHFYSKMIPELEELIEKGKESDDPEKVAAAETLAAKLEEVLNDDNHRWYINKLSPEELEERKRRQDEFKQRYE
ncbi:multiheme c-type cytochrome [Novipirellula artificiosorum]|uniref:Hydroxylamine oxidoreductase n=1 Tax=Novipirellula artificiosorum TaxID=2528016 RepID=A0A5C6DX05_9BACT|nr:multiheme c-type cytochrome [Novipirellula artificiosorum]TWU41963.1 Hydroxylamine oxidoreductase precursor [Novipirellula artificiosorum]